MKWQDLSSFDFSLDFSFSLFLNIVSIGNVNYQAKGRSSHQRCSMKNDVVKNFTKFTGKQL